MNYEEMNAAEILASLANPETINKPISKDEKHFISNIVSNKINQLELEVILAFKEMQTELMRGYELKKKTVTTNHEKLNWITSKYILPKQLLTNLSQNSKTLVEKYKRGKLRINNFPVNLSIYRHEKTKGREPHLVIFKHGKSNLRIAKKIPRKIYEESKKRELTTFVKDYRWEDGILQDLKGMQLITLKPYSSDRNKSFRLIDDPINYLTYFFKKSNNIQVVKINSFYEDSSDYNALHIKARYRPIGLINPESMASPDIFEIQIIALDDFVEKEMGELSQGLYALKQDKFMDREFVEELKKSNHGIIQPTKDEIEYIRKAKRRILSVLNYSPQ